MLSRSRRLRGEAPPRAGSRRVHDSVQVGNPILSAATATASGLASRYATALFELADERSALDAVAGDLATVETMLAESEALRLAIRSPVVSRKGQAAAVTALAERAGLGELVRNFLGVLARSRRLLALSGIIGAFRARLAAQRGEVTAEVSSAVPLDAAQLDALKESVSRFAGKAVSLKAEVDPSLLGGLVVRIGSRMVDASLKSKLRQLELAMKGVG
jgi:F-type H+-transporting ATPase subunit delta